MAARKLFRKTSFLLPSLIPLLKNFHIAPGFLSKEDVDRGPII